MAWLGMRRLEGGGDEEIERLGGEVVSIVFVLDETC